MATTAAAPTYASSYPTTAGGGIMSWLTTVDHKKIGALYLYTALFFFMFGGLEAVLIRIQLAGPNGNLLTAEQYNQLFTMHGTTMIFLAVMPLSAAFFNFLIPLQIGARDVAFPRLNAFSYWVYLCGAIVITLPIFGWIAPNAGWFGYAPLTTMPYSPGLNIDFWVIGLQILGVSSLAAAFNFATTIINMRAPGMNLMRMPIFTWMSFIVQFLLILAFPVITIALIFLQFDRFFGTAFYDIAKNADPLLWQHLFWIFGHPEVYILILPAFGLASEVIPTFSKKPLFGYPVMVYSGIVIGFLGFGVWAHHMFAVGMGAIADSIFALSTMLIAIPTGVKICNWIMTMWGGSIRFTVAMKFAIALVALFTIGGISGIMHSSPPADLQQTDSYFVVAHFHYVLFGGSIMGIMAGIYFYYPKLTGRFLSESLGNWHFWLYFLGMNITFFPMHYAGLLGMPRRTYRYDAAQGWDTFNMMSTAGTALLVMGSLFFAWNLWRARKGPANAGNNPWDAPTLEWAIPSPPPEYNFARIPQVTSRYPLWDLTHPERMTDVPHSEYEDKELKVDVAGKNAGTAHPNPLATPETTGPEGSRPSVYEPYTGKSAAELGIPMPNPSIKPLLTALAMTVMFCGLFFLHMDMKGVGIAIMIGGALWMTVQLYTWLLTPLEDHH
jgi:cytochrome c oxidase subunit I